MKYLTGLAFLLPSAIFAQTSGPAFEVASVKPHEVVAGSFYGGTGGGIELVGNRVTLTGTIEGFVMSAYNMKAYQVSGGPGWTTKEGRVQWYDITAKTEGDAIPAMDQVRQMLQTLLADRFQLKVHRDTKEMPVYQLVVGKNGLKLKESAPGTESKSDIKSEPGPIFKLKYANVTMAGLVSRLGHNFDRPLLDRTGLKAGYDFTLEYSPAVPEMTGAEAEAYAQRTHPPTGPPIKDALQDQLGLSVVQAKEPIEIIVIDHAEKPSAN